jgi:hypothetical protein
MKKSYKRILLLVIAIICISITVAVLIVKNNNTNKPSSEQIIQPANLSEQIIQPANLSEQIIQPANLSEQIIQPANLSEQIKSPNPVDHFTIENINDIFNKNNFINNNEKRPDYVLIYTMQFPKEIDTHKPYTDTTNRNKAYFDLLLGGNNENDQNKWLKIPLEEQGKPGNSMKAYINLCLYRGFPKDRIKIVLNIDTDANKQTIFGEITHRSQIIVFGHCCETCNPNKNANEESKDDSNNVLCLSPTDEKIICQNSDLLINQSLPPNIFASYFSYIPETELDSELFISLYVCNGFIHYCKPLLTELKSLLIYPLVLSQNNLVDRCSLRNTANYEVFDTYYTGENMRISYMNSDNKQQDFIYDKKNNGIIKI